jgi:hypothetical protein
MTHADLLRSVREKAQARIKGSMFADAEASKAEIEKVGGAIAARYDGFVSQAPLKSEERASQKVAMDYEGDWYGIKDLARMTIIVPTLAQCRQVLEDIRREFTASKRRGLLQVKEVLPEGDPCGYSSLTVFVRTSNERAAEIQINIPEIIYAKQSESSVTRILGTDGYLRIKGKYQLEGGLGHVLYEIYRVSPASADGMEAAEVSKHYYAYFRAGVPDIALRGALTTAIDGLRRRNPGAFIKH